MSCSKTQPPLFTPEELDMFYPIYYFQQVFLHNIRSKSPFNHIFISVHFDQEFKKKIFFCQIFDEIIKKHFWLTKLQKLTIHLVKMKISPKKA